MKIKIAGLVPESIVDGPGIRFTVFTQGCPHNCKGCHNPSTHDFSGGEPFCQCKPLAELADKIHQFKGFPLNVIAYTGYTFEYLIQNANEENGYTDLLSRLDYLVDGPFILEKRSLDLKFMGSSNQRYIDVQKSLKHNKVIALSQEELSLM